MRTPRWSLAMVAALVACSPPPAGESAAVPAGRSKAAPASAASGDAAPPDDAAAPAEKPVPEDPPRPPAVDPRPAWLGTRVLPRRPDGFGEVRPTPAILRNRRLESPAHLPDPARDRFAADIQMVPDDVLERSTWSPECPVGRHDLRYVTLHFVGFDQRPHTGELLVHASAAGDLVRVFRRLYRARFPIEEMRVVTAAELDAPPTGDGNNTTGFVCRATRSSTSWSQHAYGLAVDVNPFHNPYTKGDLVLPELASAYVDRGRRRPGMITGSGPVVRAFIDIGWTWGGTWSAPLDLMHFSANGR